MKKVFLFIMLLGCFGCSQDEEPLLPVYSNTDISNSYQLITKLASEFANSIERVTRNQSTLLTSSIYALKRSDFEMFTRSDISYEIPDDTIMYAINFSGDRGFALVTVEKPYPEVVAYIEHGSFNPTEKNQNRGFQMFMNNLYSYMSVRNAISNSFDSSFINPNQIWEIDTLARPLLTTTWCQIEPYNAYCPLKPDSVNHYDVGCVAVATAQIVAFHEYPFSYNGHYFNWQSIKEESEPLYTNDKVSVAWLMADIGRLVDMQYDPNWSHTNSNKVAKCLDSLGYHHTGMVDYDFQTCMEEFLANRPVYIKGSVEDSVNSGHAWVVDGGIVRSMYITAPDSNGILDKVRIKTQRLIHCNWGQRGRYDGYYLSDAMDMNSVPYYNSTRAPYNKDIQIYKEIYPLDSIH